MEDTKNITHQFQRIYDLNRLWSNKQDCNDVEAVKRQLSFIPEELDELQEAFENYNLTECLDAYLDIIVFSVGALYLLEKPVDFALDGLSCLIISNQTSVKADWGDPSSEAKYHNHMFNKLKGLLNAANNLVDTPDYTPEAYIRDIIELSLLWCINRNINPAEALSEVNTSNESKFCFSKDKLDESMIFLDHQNIGAYSETVGDNVWVIKSFENQTSGNKHYPKGKVLKPVTFVEPDLSKFILTVS